MFFRKKSVKGKVPKKVGGKAPTGMKLSPDVKAVYAAMQGHGIAAVKQELSTVKQEAPAVRPLQVKRELGGTAKKPLVSPSKILKLYSAVDLTELPEKQEKVV